MGTMKRRKFDKLILTFLLVILVFSLMRTQSVKGINSKTYIEDFTNLIQFDSRNTNATGWGSGTITIPRKIPSLVGVYATPGYAVDVFVTGDHAYIADGQNGLHVVNIADPTTPTFAGLYSGPFSSTYSTGIYVVGDFAYVADGGQGLQVINISDPTAPTRVGNYTTPDWAHDVFVLGNYAYVGCSSSGLQVIDISDPTLPTFIGSYNTPGWAGSVFVVGDYAYVADNNLQVVNISDPTTPTLDGFYNTPGYGNDVFVKGDLAYIADYYHLQVVNISDPTMPTLVGSVKTPDGAAGVFVAEKYAWLANYQNGLTVVNITNPTNPQVVASGWEPPDSTEVSSVFGNDNYMYLVGRSKSTGMGKLWVMEVVDFSQELEYESSAIAQSGIIDRIYLYLKSREGLISATLTSSDFVNSSLGTSIDYYLSVDDGHNWEQVTVGIKHYFSEDILDIYEMNLRWKAVLKTENPFETPILDEIVINYEIILKAPSLLSPVDNYANNDITPIFEWSDIQGASSYVIELDILSNFSSANLIREIISSTSYIPTAGLSNGTWYWRVAAIDEEGDLGIFSTFRSLIIDTSPSVTSSTTTSPAVTSGFGILLLLEILTLIVIIKKNQKKDFR